MGKTIGEFTDGIKAFLFVIPEFPIPPGSFVVATAVSDAQKRPNVRRLR